MSDFAETFRSKRHLSNVTIHGEPPCGHVQLLSFHDRCQFISKTEACQDTVHYIDYLNFIYCTIGDHSQYAYIGGVILVSILCFYLFIVLGTTADKFFCPALAVISKVLKLSENLAGVTILAFGNGSPDIFTSLSNATSDTELMYAELIGAAAFVTGFIAGVIIFVRPFKIVGRNYVRDVFFFLIAAIHINHAIHDQQYSIYEGIATIMIYVCYLISVVADHLWMKRKSKALRRLTSNIFSEQDSARFFEAQRKAEDIEEITEIKIHNRKDSSVILDEEIFKIFQEEVHGNANDGIFKTFLRSLNPFENWNEASCFGKVFMIIKAPIVFFLLLVIPIVDYGENLHGWSKLLNIFHLFSVPLLILFVTGLIKSQFVEGFPVWSMVLIFSFALASAVFFTSRNDQPPKYHNFFAIGSFISSVSIIYSVAQEVVAALNALGVISDMTDSMLGLSILAWGNSIGDLFSTVALAKQGYHQMAFAACFGGPLFNSLLGVGLTFIIKALNSDGKKAFTREGAMGPNCILFLILILTFTMISLLFTNFRARKSTGIFMIALYVLFIFYSLLGELEIIHPYGTDHQMT